MASEKFTREYGYHLVDEVLKGRMTRRQLLVRASVFGFSATAAAQLLAACGSSGGTSSSSSPAASGTPAPVMGGTLSLIGPAPITAPDPVTIYDQGGIVLVTQFLEFLIDLNNDNSLKAKLAESWSPNDTLDVWTVKLRQGVTFNNGQPFEAEDVVTTVNRLLDPKGGSGGAKSQWGGVLSPGHTKAIDTHTVQFNLDKPYADFPYTISSGNYNTAILPRNFKGDILKSPVGTGPFMLKTYVNKQKATFVKNPTYWGKDAQGRQLPYLDGLTYVMVEDNSAQNLQLQSGAVDCQPQTVFQGAQALFSDPNLRVDIYPGTGIREVAFNVTKSPWQSQDLRQAVAWCLDRKAINQTLYGGHSNLGYDTFWEPTVFPGSPTPPTRQQDYDKAKQLLSSGGKPSGFSATLTVAKYLENPQLAQLIQAQCKPAGINIAINQISYTAFYAGSSSDYYGTTPWIVAPMTIVEWGSRPAPGIYAAAMLLPNAVWSSSHWNDPQFAKTFNKYESTVDEQTRASLAQQLSTMQQTATPIMLAFFISQARTQKKNVYGIQGPGSFYCDCSQAFKTA
ncbi:MAG TPA: ABC transporter substrate-binding protein [Thermoleophilia bacterium]|nr:ABC transporter substrate-binding protein [Thermoleophilia bacterium]